jgi:hypothetical protein
MARVGLNFAGWAVGGNIYRESVAQGSTTNNGWSVDLSGSLLPGFSLTGEYAQFQCGTVTSCPTATTAQETAYQATVAIDVSGMMGGAPKLSVWYKNYPTTWDPVYPGSCEAICRSEFQNLNVYGGQLTLTLSDQLRPYFKYETGTRPSAAGTFTEYEVGIRSRVSSTVDARVRYQNRTDGTAIASPTDRYRVELFYSW